MPFGTRIKALLMRSILLHSLIYQKFNLRMCSKWSYEEAVHKLNSLQSNKSTLEQIRHDIKCGQKCSNLDDMKNYFLRTEVSFPKLDNLSVIHIAGTKGKGSTSAMCESILRHHGFKTGFYSSPHLVTVTERIRLDGKIISKEKFAKHFQEVYDMLDASQTFRGDMPKYFAFLTVLAFNIFIKEKVDVAIIEVGIGGIVDYTNILRKVPIVGITSLGLDHTSILGNTLSEIAEAKAGIMKQGCEAYTVEQPPEAMKVLQKVAFKKKCPLYIVPDYENYNYPNGLKSKLHVDLPAYKMNASLAIQLAHAWMRKANVPRIANEIINIHEIKTNLLSNNNGTLNESHLQDVITILPNETILGLNNCRWPGRYQLVKTDYADFYLDGAHTKESMEICVEWFNTVSRHEQKILIFSATGDRDPELLLRPLLKAMFKTVIFVVPNAYKEINDKSDNFSVNERNELIAKYYKYSKVWQNINMDFVENSIIVNDCVSDALVQIEDFYKQYSKTSVLITGSLHLVGAALSILDPSLCAD